MQLFMYKMWKKTRLCIRFCLYIYNLKKGWLPTAVYWTGEFHGLYSPGGHKESDVIELLSLYIYKEILDGYGGG